MLRHTLSRYVEVEASRNARKLCTTCPKLAKNANVHNLH